MTFRGFDRTKSAAKEHITRAFYQVNTALGLIRSGRAHVIFDVLRRRIATLRSPAIEYLSVDMERNTESSFTAKPYGSSPRHDGNEHTPLVSVIIPCFNYGQFLEKAINSVLAQTFEDLEIIVVEGGSTDGTTPAIVRELKKDKTRVITQSQPTLVGENRNAGIAEARGRYICCLDPDDTLEPTYIEKAVYLLEAHCYDIVSTGIRFSGGRNGTVDVMETPDLKAMMRGNHITTCAVFRRQFWQQVGGYFDTGKGQDHVAEDWDFWLRCVAAGARVRNITGEHLFNYFIHDGGSLSSSNVRSMAFQRQAIIARNKAVLTTDAIAQSRFQAIRRIVRTPEGCMRAANSPSDKRSLLVVVPFMIVGGAEKLLTSVIRYLVASGWSVTVVSTLQQKGLNDSSGWFKEFTSEVYSLPQFLNQWEYESFFRYIIGSRTVDATLLAGSRVFYELLPKLCPTFPHMAVVDLLFNTVGHVASHVEFKPYLTSAIAENPEVFSWLKQQGWNQERIRLVKSGVDVLSFDTCRSEKLVTELGIKTDEIVVGFSGRLSDEKGPDIFLEIAAAFRDEPSIRFLMTGAGPLQQKVESDISKLPAGSRIQFLGLVDSTEDYFATYDIFVLPSRIDGRPIALMEALSSGCAVVASRVGGVPALIEESGAGILCAPDDTEDFVNAIRVLISDRNRLTAMKKLARESAIRMLSIEQMGTDYLAALEAAIELKRSANAFDVTVAEQVFGQT